MVYQPPVGDILFSIQHIADGFGGGNTLDAELTAAILDEAGKLCAGEIAATYDVAEQSPPVLEDGVVTTPDAYHNAYRAWCEGGWPGLTGPDAHGGQALPQLLAVGVHEMLNAASMSFATGPVLTLGAIEALAAHASPELQATYLPKLLSGEWTGTMNLTEPQAGSDLALLRSTAVPQDDGTYRISGTKIYISYGEHDLTDNIVHLVLARLPDAPPGTRGISLFLVPKVLVNEGGSLGERNDVWCTGVEHKMGLHGSPTCTLTYGDNGGAVGYLVGEENRGLHCMFTMMNNARLVVGIQGVGVAEAAFQRARHYAAERRQGRHAGMDQTDAVAIIEHPDIRRELMVIRAQTAAARALCHLTAAALDSAHHSEDKTTRAHAQARADLLTPLAKAYSTDIGIDGASRGVQVHGGMGFIEETGAAQLLRDVRVAAIYEGTNGIQAIDLVTRKLPMQGGAVAAALVDVLKQITEDVAASSSADIATLASTFGTALDDFEAALSHFARLSNAEPDKVLAGASAMLRLAAVTTGGIYLGKGIASAASAGEDTGPLFAAQFETARFFATHLMPETATQL
ncbi:MAG: acyl-CoA dehydrogenase, partial [Pseudomonadota bacterium]